MILVRRRLSVVRASGALRPRRSCTPRWPCREHSGLLGIVSEVDVAHGLLGQLRSQQRVIRVAVAQSEQDAFLAVLIASLIVREQELADPLERIVSAPAAPSCSAWTCRRTLSLQR